MRVFVALDIPAEVRRALAEFTRCLDKTCAGARWVQIEGMHVTLKFIGEASPGTVERVIPLLAKIHFPAPVELRFRGVGFFPNDRHPRVFWAGIDASANLAELAAAVEDNLESAGIPPETRPFMPHLTLARFKSEDGLDRLRNILSALAPFEFGALRTAEFHFYHSLLKSSGAEYKRLATFSFVKGAS